MKFHMAFTAHPTHIERFSVIIVMLLGVCAALFAGLRHQETASLIDICIAPSVSFLFFYWRKVPMFGSVLSHPFRVARLAVTLPNAGAFHGAHRANGFSHQCILPCFSGT